MVRIRLARFALPRFGFSGSKSGVFCSPLVCRVRGSIENVRAEPSPSTYAKSDVYVRDDFCGWSALGPISLFIEDIIGIKEANAFRGELKCDFARDIKGRAG